ncbi:MAG: DNA cytosine methyltransferase, partial [Candidatus Limnocylindrus sp.]
MTQLTFVELFAGVGGLSMGLETAGWKCVGHAEWDAFPRRVLKHRWPEVPLWGDVSKLNGYDIVKEVGPFTMLTFGAPCQDFSIAGRRSGMDGERSVLVLDALRIWEESGAPYALYENVVGMLSSNNGADFAAILSVFVGDPVAVPARGWKG